MTAAEGAAGRDTGAAAAGSRCVPAPPCAVAGRCHNPAASNAAKLAERRIDPLISVLRTNRELRLEQRVIEFGKAFLPAPRKAPVSHEETLVLQSFVKMRDIGAVAVPDQGRHPFVAAEHALRLLAPARMRHGRVDI